MAFRSPTTAACAHRPPPAKPDPSCPPQSKVVYNRRRPELTALHRIIQAEFPRVERLCREAGDGHPLPEFISRAFKRYCDCGRLVRGLVRLHCPACRQDELVALSCKVRGLCPSCDGRRMTEESAHLLDEVIPHVPVRQWVLSLPYDLRYLLAWNRELRSAVLGAFMRAIHAHYRDQAKTAGLGEPKTGAISVVQRFNSAVQLDVHFHVLFADGVWEDRPSGPVFHSAPPLHTIDVQQVLYDAWLRIGRQLVRLGYQDRDLDTLRDTEPALASLLRAAVSGRQVTGDEAGQKPKRVGAGQKLAPRPHGRNCAQFDAFSLHANTRVGAAARADLERLVRYVCRPAVSASRIEAVEGGKVRIALKNSWRDGTTHVVIPRADLVLRMAAQVPLPKRPSVRYHGCFAPNAKLRSKIVPAGDKAKCRRKKGSDPGELSERQTSTRMLYAEAMRRGLSIDVLACPCGGRRVVLAAVMDAQQVERILRHVGLWPDSEDIEAIRGPPEDLWGLDPAESDDFDALDELPPLDHAA